MIKYYVERTARRVELGWDGQPFQIDPRSLALQPPLRLQPLCVLAGAAELAATALFAWYAFGLGSIGGAFSGTLALGILALRAILALALGLYAWRCLCREWRNGPPLLTTLGPPLPALALLILLPADLELLQLVPWRRRQLDGLPTAALLGLTATLSLSHNLATLLLLAYTAAAVAPPPLRPLPVVCGVLALRAAFLGIRRAAMLLGCCGADAAAEQKYDACTADAGDAASAEAAMTASVAAVDLEMAERGAAGGAEAARPPSRLVRARRGARVPRRRRRGVRSRGNAKPRRARDRARSGSPASDTARASAAHVPHQRPTRPTPPAPPPAPPPAASAARPRPPTAATTAPPPTAPPPPPPPPRRARRASAPRPAPPTDPGAAAAAIAAAAEATTLEEDAAASIAADEAAAEDAADDGGGDLEPSAPLVPAETPGVDRTAAAVADPASYTRRINRAREASLSRRTRSQVRLVRGPAAARARVERRQRSKLGLVAANPRGGGGGKPGRPPPSQEVPFRVLPRRAPPRRAPPSTARDAPRLTRKRSSLPTIRDFGETLEGTCSVIAT